MTNAEASDEDAQHLLGDGSRRKKSHSIPISAKTCRNVAIILFACAALAIVADMTGLAPWRSLIAASSVEDEYSHVDSPTDLRREMPVVQTLNGSIKGLHSAHFNQDYFLGVPYAKPPIGELRFRKPQSLDSKYDGVRLADEYANRCVGYIPRDSPMGEDCLYLNIFRPRDKNGKLLQDLPVLVWVHGGGFTGGSADVPQWKFFNLLHHSTLVHKPFIAISINYRLSAWGFMGGDLVASSGETNLGLRDQRMALEWIKENVEAFGGDPSKVTIDGQSAGAFSVGYHLTAFGGRDDGLFRAGILQSGNPGNFGKMQTVTAGDQHFQNLVDQAGCGGAEDPIGCLRNAPFETLNSAIIASGPDWRAAIDGDFIQKQTSKQLAQGEFVHVPIMIGANTDEGTSFTRQGINDEAALLDIFRSRESHTESFDALLRAYPDDPCVGIPESMACTRPAEDSPLGAQYRRAAAFVGDFMFIANRRHTCRTWAEAGLAAYCYRFDARRPQIPPSKGCAHSEEVPFVFDGEGLDTPENRLVSRLMGNFWASFVSDLDPNAWRRSGDYAGAEIVNDVARREWPRYNVASPKDYLFKVGDSGVEDDTWRAEGIELIIKNNEADGR